MQTIYLKDAVGKYAITDLHAETVYNLIHPILSSGDSVEICSSGCAAIPVFINNLVFRLLQQHTVDTIKKSVRWKDEENNSILDNYVETLHRYLTDPNYKKAVDDAIKNVMEEDY